jgi:hypothetical protein
VTRVEILRPERSEGHYVIGGRRFHPAGRRTGPPAPPEPSPVANVGATQETGDEPVSGRVHLAVGPEISRLRGWGFTRLVRRA